MAYVIGLDIGTTSTIGLLIKPGEPSFRYTASRAVSFYSEHSGWAEENPMQWWENVCSICQELLEASGIRSSEITSVGVTGMLPAVVLLDQNEQLIRRSIQQSDGRCQEQVVAIKEEIDERDFLLKSGNGINQQLVAAKLRWLEQHEPDHFSRINTVFGSYDYINWRLTQKKAVDRNWALEAGFIDVYTGQLCPDLIRLAHVEPNVVPELSLSHEMLGTISRCAAEQTGLCEGTMVVGGSADHIASAYGAGVHQPGDVLLKFGGSVDVLISSDTAVPDERMYLDYHLLPGLYMPNGCMASGGSGLNWFVREFAKYEAQLAERKKVTPHAFLDSLSEEVPAGCEGVYALPYLLGEKTPIHDPLARGVFSGLSLNHGVPHLWRALLESFAYAIRHHIEVFQDMGFSTQRFWVSDGGSNSEFWMQIVSDVIQQPLQTLEGHPGSCLGAAWMAAVGCGLSSDFTAVSDYVSYSKKIEPNAQNHLVYQQGYESYKALYQQLQPIFSAWGQHD
ncbi:FGGY-family carbohydrate kinase [Vibrio sp. S9_S30]|uniref:FGGY-family carbohydrate kinase n=1 Tax=Vibrio sp. S9_S30 TaxID=2720226 RepID=UPI001680FF52|nr:FGGY-family carbohydrate kinase [Vibrio sp. S9_S30]MBD1558193.1 FGGY-family carbohydrate kinase [Vibrio sp. S9_S30]